MCKTDIELCIKEVKNGHRDAYGLIIETYQHCIFKYVRYMVQDQWATDDIVQEVFIKVYTNLKQYKENTNFEGWLYKIAYNHTMSRLKKMSRDPHVYTDQLPEVAYLDHYKSDLPYEMTYTLGKLSAEDRALLFLRAYEELSYKEIGRIMKIRDSILRKRYERAKEKFIKYYKEVPQDETRRVQTTTETIC